MKFLCTGDVHASSKIILGRERLPVIMQWLDDCLELCRREHIEHFFWAGDVIDQKHGVNREVLLSLHGWLQKASIEGLRVHWIRGNHETPRNNAPNDTLMKMFSEVCDVITTPKIMKLGEVIIACMPWYPSDPYKRNLRNVVRIVKKQNGPKVLITHVGLREGRCSPSNIQLPQRVGVRDLYPAEWDMVLVGDYHRSQQLAANVLYMGSPMQHTFGDEGHDGPWVFNEGGILTNLRAKLMNRYPQFRKWRLDPSADIGDLPGYDGRDYNWITCSAEHLKAVETLYPGARVRPSQATDKPVDLSGSRLSSADVGDPVKLIDRYCTINNITDDYTKKLANWLVGEARRGS